MVGSRYSQAVQVHATPPTLRPTSISPCFFSISLPFLLYFSPLSLLIIKADDDGNYIAADDFDDDGDDDNVADDDDDDAVVQSSHEHLVVPVNDAFHHLAVPTPILPYTSSPCKWGSISPCFLFFLFPLAPIFLPTLFGVSVLFLWHCSLWCPLPYSHLQVALASGPKWMQKVINPRKMRKYIYAIISSTV